MSTYHRLLKSTYDRLLSQIFLMKIMIRSRLSIPKKSSTENRSKIECFRSQSLSIKVYKDFNTAKLNFIHFYSIYFNSEPLKVNKSFRIPIESHFARDFNLKIKI